MSKRELRRQLAESKNHIEELQKSLTRARLQAKESQYRMQERIRVENLSGSPGQSRAKEQWEKSLESVHRLEELLSKEMVNADNLQKALKSN